MARNCLTKYSIVSCFAAAMSSPDSKPQALNQALKRDEAYMHEALTFPLETSAS